MGARILIVEDNPANLELMIYLLQALGHETSSAMDGSDALASARCRAPDLVICDLQLPRVDGYEVARQMKADRSLAGIPIIAVTAYAMPGDRESAFAAGFNGYISKPIVPERFIQQIGELLARAGLPQSDLLCPQNSSTRPRAGILVIEDHPAARRRIARVLENRGFEIVFADSVEQAKAERLQDKADLVIAGADVDARAIMEFGFIDQECLLWPAPLSPRELITQVESLLAERMRVT